MITQVYVQCLRRLKVILKYVMDHVENSAPVPVVILELGGNAQNFAQKLESTIRHTRDYSTISSTCVRSCAAYLVLK